MMTKIKIAIIGVGKITLDQHIPSIKASDAFELVGFVSSRKATVDDLPSFETAAELYAAIPELDAVAINTPPNVRHTLVREAIDAGKKVLMEKPPATTVSEFLDLEAYAREKGQVLFATWHSQFNPAVDRVRDILARDGVRKLRIDWRESVRKWHPGQDWVWAPGGFGVCDPGINALSILTKIMPEPVFVASARLAFPANRQTPVDVEIAFKTARGADGPSLSAGFNWLEESGEVWTFTIETGTGDTLLLENGGAKLTINGSVELEAPNTEYPMIYERFAQLCASGQSEVHGAPLMLTADVFALARRETAEAFDW